MVTNIVSSYPHRPGQFYDCYQHHCENCKQTSLSGKVVPAIAWIYFLLLYTSTYRTLSDGGIIYAHIFQYPIITFIVWIVKTWRFCSLTRSDLEMAHTYERSLIQFNTFTMECAYLLFVVAMHCVATVTPLLISLWCSSIWEDQVADSRKDNSTLLAPHHL